VIVKDGVEYVAVGTGAWTVGVLDEAEEKGATLESAIAAAAPMLFNDGPALRIDCVSHSSRNYTIYDSG
jgi:hypothetical protein